MDKLAIIRRNILKILEYGNVTPFQWLTRGFRCFYCDEPMTDPETLKSHVLETHLSVDLVAFVSEKVKTRFLPIKLDISDIACNVCEIPMDSLDGLIGHIVAVHDEVYDDSYHSVFPFILTSASIKPCAICEAVFDNFSSLVTHMYKTHVDNSLMCQICGRRFMDSVRLMRHMKASHLDCVCKICNKTLSTYTKLVRHKQTVHGTLKTYTCDVCEVSFKNKYQLTVHMGNVHNVAKYRIKCEFCPKICTTKGAMVLHVRSVHSEPEYECDVCDYKTAIKWMLKLHKRRHVGVKDYACSVCKKSFGRSSNLRAHMRVHTGCVGKVCRWCRKGFTDSNAFDEHEKGGCVSR